MRKLKTSGLLKMARKLIESGYTSYLCIALDRAHTLHYGTGFKHNYIELKKRINKSIYPYTDVGTWLRYNRKIKSAVLDNRQAMRDYRLRWCDALIAEYEAKGD
jgi:fructose-1,6-bisphosphatase